jgi:hypothetical protein
MQGLQSINLIMEERLGLTVNKQGMRRLGLLTGLSTHIHLGRALLISRTTTGTKAADLRQEQLQLVNT